MAFLDVALADAFGQGDREDVDFKRNLSLAQSLRGTDQTDALKEAQAAQLRLAREALATQVGSQFRLEETLAPFVGFGANLAGQVPDLYGGNVAQGVAASPTLQAFNQFGNEAIASNPFLAGLDPSGIESQQLINNIDLLSRERGDLLSAIGLGQASAAQQASGQIETGARRADLLSQIGNVQAAGGIAQANLAGQQSNQLAGIGAGLFSAFGGGS